jgi:Domain of unknown function (DUF5122) beta-propeller
MGRPLVVLLAVLLVVASAGPALAVNPPGDSAQTDEIVRDIGFGNGRMYLGGQFTRMRPDGAPAGSNEVTRNHAGAISINNGAIDPWNPNVNGTVYAVEVVGDIVYLGGSFTSVGGVQRNRLAAVDAITGAVLPWSPSAGGPVREISVAPNGNLFVGGSFGTISGQARSRIAQITPGGQLVNWSPTVAQVTGFACPPRCSPIVFAIDFSNDGQIVYFGGHFGRVNGVSRNNAAAVPADSGGTLLPWNPNLHDDANCPTCTNPETFRVYTIITTSTKMYLCGSFWRRAVGPARPFNIYVTDLVNGTPDPTWAAGTDGDTPACALHNGVLYAGGHFNWVGPICSQNPPGRISGTQCTQANGSTRRNHVAAFNATTGAILSWNPTANSNLGPFVAQEAPGVLGWGGHFTRFGAVAQEGVAKYTQGFAA